MTTIRPIIKAIDKATSTNTLLHEWIALENVPEGSILVAHTQTAGKGQKGNSWHSEPGKNLTFSMVLYPHTIAIHEQFILSQVVSLGVKRVLDRYIQAVSVKWPNDIYAGNGKIAGILIENNLSGRTIDSCIIGIGLNVNQATFPEELPNPVSLYQLICKESDLTALLQEIQHEIYTDYLRVLSDPTRKNAVQDEFHAALYRKEGAYAYIDKKREEIIHAHIARVSPTGTLTLELENGEQRSYLFKEVEYILSQRD